MITVYGSTDNKNIHTDTSNTLLGAKQYATRNGLNNVSVRIGYKVTMLECKVFGKWFEFCNNTNTIILTNK
jgi:hypothetical protein